MQGRLMGKRLRTEEDPEADRMPTAGSPPPDWLARIPPRVAGLGAGAAIIRPVAAAIS